MKILLTIFFFSISSLFAFEHLDENNFSQKTKNKNVIIDFYATWWPACKVLGKNLTKYDASKQENVTIYKVDIEKQKQLVKNFNIRGIPTLVYLKNGKFIAKELGVKSEKQLKENVIKYVQ